jgi:hypothetical protein
MSAPTFTDQAIRNLAGRLRAANCEPGTDRDGYDASYAIEQLLRERGALAARLEHVSHAVHIVTRDLAALPADEVRRMLHEALNEVAW